MRTQTIIRDRCTGPNRHCRAAAREGRLVHIIPGHDLDNDPVIILPTNHYATAQGARDALAAAADAPIVTCDDDLYRYRAAGVAHRLPVGWVDPTRR